MYVHTSVHHVYYIYTYKGLYMSMPVCRLEYQISSLERELETQKEVSAKAETRLSELLEKLDAAPKQEVLDRYKEEVEKLTGEVGGVKEALKEWGFYLIHASLGFPCYN